MRRMGWTLSILAGLMLCVLCGVAYLLSPAFSRSLTRGLGEEKSYFEHAGALFQLRPELRGQKGNLETWDEAEAIATAVQREGPKGNWASWTDQVTELPEPLRLDPSRRPMCVIRTGLGIYVVRGVKRPVARCDAVTPGFSVSGVRSGELAPSSDGLAEIYYQRFAP